MNNLKNMSPSERKELMRQLEVIKKADLANYEKGDMIVSDMSVNKGGGVVLRFKGSRFPINIWKSQLDQIVKHSTAIYDFIESNDCK